MKRTLRSYDAFGAARNGDISNRHNGTLNLADTIHGFTGHTHADDVGLILMRGRVFDPNLGRFLSVAYRQDTFAHERLGEPLDEALKFVPLIGAADTVANCAGGNCGAADLAIAMLGVVLPESKVLAPVEDAARVASRIGGRPTKRESM